jgi:hypothetical protein
MLDAVEVRDRYEFDVAEMMSETFLDLDQIVAVPRRGTEVRAEARRQASEAYSPAEVEGARWTKGPIFTEFADTARYLKRQLDKAGIEASRRSTALPKATAPMSSSASRRTTTVHRRLRSEKGRRRFAS